MVVEGMNEIWRVDEVSMGRDIARTEGVERQAGQNRIHCMSESWHYRLLTKTTTSLPLNNTP